MQNVDAPGPAAGLAAGPVPERDIELRVNGDAKRVPAGTDVAGLLVLLGLDARKVAVELNEAIVPRSTYAGAALGGGDRIEIVHFIGGG